MDKIKNMREAAEAKIKQTKLAAENLPKGLSIATDIVSQCTEILANALNLFDIINKYPAIDLDSLKQAVQNLREISSNTKELITSLKEILNELKTAFGDGNKETDKMSKIEKGIYRIDRVVQESCDVLDVTIEIVELVTSNLNGEGGNEISWDGVKEMCQKLVKEVKEMKDAFLGKDGEEDDEDKQESKKAEAKVQKLKATKSADGGEPEESGGCWEKISSIFCCCCTD